MPIETKKHGSVRERQLSNTCIGDVPPTQRDFPRRWNQYTLFSIRAQGKSFQIDSEHCVGSPAQCFLVSSKKGGVGLFLTKDSQRYGIPYKSFVQGFHLAAGIAAELQLNQTQAQDAAE